ncbi:hypothetical protein PVAP13_9NG457414 [Panicum virgatum]|uniref:Uncharacterized protein n=1 Tax=Panicum virgatum TaxID=38727 RepID=A0A8T0MQI0_PANVG|nr:hypothetical protein PVAP13_9NG457414 [Panicum virgatum]
MASAARMSAPALMVALAVLAFVAGGSAQLQYGFYKGKCNASDVEAVVQSFVKARFAREAPHRRLPPPSAIPRVRRQWVRRRPADRRPRHGEDGAAEPERQGLRPHRGHQGGAGEEVPRRDLVLRHRDPRHQGRGGAGRRAGVRGAHGAEGPPPVPGLRRQPPGAGVHGGAGRRVLRQAGDDRVRDGGVAGRAHGGRHALQLDQEQPAVQVRRQARRDGPQHGPGHRVGVQEVGVPERDIVGRERRVPGRPVECPEGGQQLLQEPAAPPRCPLR